MNDGETGYPASFFTHPLSSMEPVDIFEGFANVPVIYLVPVANEGREEGLVADIVDHSRDAQTTHGDLLDGPRGKLWLAVAAGERETM